MRQQATIEREANGGAAQPAPAASAPTRTADQPPRFSGRNRYSRFVGLMKVVLPALAAALVVLVVAWPHLRIDSDRFRLGISQFGFGQPDNLSMVNARFNGVDEKNRPFTITADLATQSSDNQNMIALELPKADMTLQDGSWLALTARAGDYDQDREQLALNGDVNLFHDDGFELHTSSALIDLADGVARGDDPVEGQGPPGTIAGEGFEVLDKGRRIIFTGKSRLLILPEAQESVR